MRGQSLLFVADCPTSMQTAQQLHRRILVKAKLPLPVSADSTRRSSFVATAQAILAAQRLRYHQSFDGIITW